METKRTKRLGGLAAGLALAAAATAPAAQQGLAIEHVSVIPMPPADDGGEPVLTDQTVIVEGEAIRWVGPAAEADIPQGLQRVDGTGKTLIPGLIDSRLRLLSEQHIADSFAPTELEVVAAYGVTAVRLTDGRPTYLMLRDEVLGQGLFAPELYVGSPPLTARPVGRVAAGVVPEDSHAARELVREYAAAGYDFVFLGYDLRPVVHAMIVQEARDQGLPVVGHVSWKTGLDTGLQGGVQIEHLDQFFEWLMPQPVTYGPSGMGAWRTKYWEPLGGLDDSRIPELARLVAESGTFQSPGCLYHRSAFIDRIAIDDVDPEADGRFLAPLVKEALFEARDKFERSRPDEALIRRYADLRASMIRALDEAGVPLLAGSNAPDWGHVPGLALHDELACLVGVGLSPYAALATATRNPARWLGAAGALGSIVPGARADLVLLTASPLDDIANTKAIAGVVLRGRWHGREELDATLDAAAEALSAATLRPAIFVQQQR